jgi:hypothetical protein
VAATDAVQLVHGRRHQSCPAGPERILSDFSASDVTHTLHYLLNVLENMKRLGTEPVAAENGEEEKATA